MIGFSHMLKMDCVGYLLMGFNVKHSAGLPSWTKARRRIKDLLEKQGFKQVIRTIYGIPILDLAEEAEIKRQFKEIEIDANVRMVFFFLDKEGMRDHFELVEMEE